jgi:hypothetical protein
MNIADGINLCRQVSMTVRLINNFYSEGIGGAIIGQWGKVTDTGHIFSRNLKNYTQLKTLIIGNIESEISSFCYQEHRN